MRHHPEVVFCRFIDDVDALMRARGLSTEVLSRLARLKGEWLHHLGPNTLSHRRGTLARWYRWAAQQPSSTDVFAGPAVRDWMQTLTRYKPNMATKTVEDVGTFLLGLGACGSEAAHLFAKGIEIELWPPAMSPVDKVVRVRATLEQLLLDPESPDGTLSRLDDIFSDWCCLTPNTLHAYCSAVERWSRWAKTRTVRGRKLFSAPELKSFLKDLADRGAKPSTIELRFVVIKKLATTLGWITAEADEQARNFVRPARRARAGAFRESTFLDWTDLSRMIAVVDHQDALQVRDAAIALIVYETLVLPNEILRGPPSQQRTTQFTAENFCVLRDGTARFGSHLLTKSTAEWVSRWLLHSGITHGPIFQCSETLSRRLCLWAWRAGIRKESISLAAIRAGSIRALAQGGFDTRTIQQLARRKSGDFLRRNMVGEATPAPALTQAVREGRADARLPRSPTTIRRPVARHLYPAAVQLPLFA